LVRETNKPLLENSTRLVRETNRFSRARARVQKNWQRKSDFLRADYVSEKQLWAQKRDQQKRDIEALKTGQATENDMSWFSGGRARACRLVDSPY